MAINFDRNICCDLNETISREWLVTNGLGGYAAGTVAGVLTRMQHGLLVASLPGTRQPQLLLAKVDEEISFDQRTYYLGTNEYRDGIFNPAGFVHLEAFRLQEGCPIFTYRLGGIDGLLLEKRIWMVRGFNTTYIQYTVLRPESPDKPVYTRNGRTEPLDTDARRQAEQERQEPLILTLLPFTANRPYDRPQRSQQAPHLHVHTHRTEDMALESEEGQWNQQLPAGVTGCTIITDDTVPAYHLLATGQEENQPAFIPTGVWYWNFLRRCNAREEQPDTDDLYLPGVFRVLLWPGRQDTLTIVASTEKLEPPLYQHDAIASLYEKSREQRQHTMERVLHTLRPEQRTDRPYNGATPWSQADNQCDARQLLYASEHFITRYYTTATSQEVSLDSQAGLITRGNRSRIALVAEYFAQEYRTRDALIALPGILLVTERYVEAHQFLGDLADHFIGGILPDRLPTARQALTDHSYSNADIALWYFYALDHYLRATGHYEFLEEVFPRLVECINRYRQGTHNGIHVDSKDGLLVAEKEGKALTWMNAYHEGQPVTPRSGKPIELNALWYHALILMQGWSERLEYIGHIENSGAYYQQYAERCKRSIQKRFWQSEQGYLYDVVDGPEGNDATLRVNQLFALSLPHSILNSIQQRQVFDCITRHLLTPYGLRTMAACEPGYHPHIERGSSHQRSLHQGSCWAWLLGPYVDAMINLSKGTAGEEDKPSFKEEVWWRGMQLLGPLQDRYSQGLLGMCEGIFDGDYPQHAGPQSASLLSTAELLRASNRLARWSLSYRASGARIN
ncbi:hypothetical protein KDH_49560 [Dictyobacter sp. S3.2.2.5]|uniref:Glycogen debranching protein n=1 Tax=Dictyobacter halimunensis TaxID=3026934 RepID=A0ABQ6FYP3_9CHLR|nr:hypothetical protein KDH_49560 [Dictyobacter sp. S3.2.2.5]